MWTRKTLAVVRNQVFCRSLDLIMLWTWAAATAMNTRPKMIERKAVTQGA